MTYSCNFEVYSYNTKFAKSDKAISPQEKQCHQLPFWYFEVNQNAILRSAKFTSIDNHNSGYLGMAVQLYVQARLGYYHILP